MCDRIRVCVSIYIMDVANLENNIMKMYIVFLFLIFSFLRANSQSFFVFDIDTTNFPVMKAKFYALDDKGNQIKSNINDFLLTENGQQRTVINVSCPAIKPNEAISSVLTFDASSSMYGFGISIAKEAAKVWINMLPLGASECAITSFNDFNFINQDFTTNRNSLLNAVNNIDVLGGTDYDYGLFNPEAGSLVISKSGKHKKIIVFLTDGMPNFEPQVNRIITEALSQKCVIYSVVIGMNCPDNLKDISSQTGGLWFENVNSENEAKNIYQQILMKAEGIEACDIEWKSDVQCNSNLIDLELKLIPFNLTANANYLSSYSSIAKLEFNPTSLKFFKAYKDTCIDVTVTARNANFNITDIKPSNSAYRINSSVSFNLKAGESKNLTICYTPADSGYSFCKFTIESDICQSKYFASGGFPGIKPKKRTLKLIQPNGGEVFIAGSDTIISYEGVSPDEYVSIEYRTNDSAPWVKLTDSAKGFVYKFHVPKIASDKYLARVTAKAPLNQSNCINGDVQLCNQMWMGCNLDVETYRNGDIIPEVEDSVEWSKLTTGAWCYYNNDPETGVIYGKLYNWFAVNDPRGLAPEGWHIPSNEEWEELANCLGGSKIAGGKLKETGTIHWQNPNYVTADSNVFAALPGGWRDENGSFNYIGYIGNWWTSSDTDYESENAWFRNMSNSGLYVGMGNFRKGFGFSVRCLRN